jgi:hypothetical protein
MKRMPYHRILRQANTIQAWSNNFRVDVDNLKQTILNYKNRLENTLVQPHVALEQGGHKASHIKSQNAELSTAEAFCEEIRGARGEFGSIQERMANLNGVSFVKSWGSGSELLNSYQKQTSRVFNNRLECSEEPQLHEDIFGLDNLNYENPGSDQFDEFIQANSMPTINSGRLTSSQSSSYQGNFNTVGYSSDPLNSNEKVFRVFAAFRDNWNTYSASLSYTFPEKQSSFESLLFYTEFIPTNSNPYSCYITLYTDVNKSMQIRFHPSGIYINNVFFDYSNVSNTATWLNQKHKLTISKFKNILWEVSLDGVLLARQSYYDGLPEGTVNIFTPYVNFYAEDTYGNLGGFNVKEFGLKQFSASTGSSSSIKINPNNTLTLSTGKFTGTYTSPIRSIQKDRGSVAKKVINDYTGPAPKVYARFSTSESGIKNESWTFLNNQGDILNSVRSKPYYQLKLDLSGSGSVTNQGSTLLLDTFENYKATTLCKNGNPIASSSNIAANLIKPFTNDENNLSSYWEGTERESSIITSWIGYNFNAPVSVKTIIFAQAYIFASSVTGWNWLSSIKVQKSDDGTSWQDVKTYAIVADSRVQIINVPETEPAQYWRLKANSQSVRSSSYIGWALSLLQMFDEEFILKETQESVTITDKLYFQGSTSQGIPNGDFSNELEGWVANAQVTNLDPTKIAAWQEASSGPYQINGIDTSLQSPNFVISGPIEIAYKNKFTGAPNTVAKLRVYDSSTNALLDERDLQKIESWTTSTYYPPKSILNKSVYLKFYVSTYWSYYLDRSSVYVGVGVSYIKLGTASYTSVPKKLEGNKVKKLNWKQKVGSGELVADSAYPVVFVKSGSTPGETLLNSEVNLPVQITPSGEWANCSVNLDQLGEYFCIGVSFGVVGTHDHLIELDEFEIEWEKITLETSPVVSKTTLQYESYLYYLDGQTYYMFDSNDKGTKWGRFFCEGGLEPTASNDNNYWDRRVLKNVTENYLTVDDFSNCKSQSVASPSPGSSFSVSGNGSNAAYLFSAYFYNDTPNDIIYSFTVSSSGSSNKWQVFRNRSSLGLNKSSYNLLLQSKAWTRVDLYFKRFGSSPENFVTNASWTSAASIMNSTQNINPEIGMFSVKTLAKLEDEPNEEWKIVGNDQAIGTPGRYLLVKVNTKATENRLFSSGTNYFGASYTGDLSSGITNSIASLAENLARTNFELKTLTLANDHNLLHIMQDVFEDSSDISELSSNIIRDSSVPGVVQVNSGYPGILVSNTFINSYIPGFAMVVSDAIGQVIYSVSRDNGVTWTDLEPSSMTPITSSPGTQIKFRAVLLDGAVLKRWALIL